MYTHSGSVVDTSVSMSPNESCVVVSVDYVLLVMESVLCWPAIPGHWACPGVWLIDPITLQWRKLIVPFSSRYKLQITSWLGVGLCVNFSLYASILSDLYLCRSYMCCQESLWVHICFSPVVSGKHSLHTWNYPLPLALKIFLPPSNINLWALNGEIW